jgi:hypothetical protein
MSGEFEFPTAVIMESCLLGCDVVQFGRISMTFRRKMLTSSSGLKSKQRRQPARNKEQTKFCLLFDPGCAGNIFLPDSVNFYWAPAPRILEDERF